MAPVAPQIIAGRPPATAVTTQMIHAEVSPTLAETPATKLKLTASGTIASDTAMPHSISFSTCDRTATAQKRAVLSRFQF